MDPRWPAVLWLVRHGESAGNVALAAAEAAGAPTIEITGREVDVPLSTRGEKQARALGHWFAQRPETERPSIVMTSPYARAHRTGALALESLAPTRPLVHVVDERLRERELGILDRLTRHGIRARYPDEVARRAQLGKLYYRPPGGESWCDVILRLRSLLDHIQLRFRDERVLLVSHQAVVLCFRYLLEEMSESQLMTIDGERELANCSLTTYVAQQDHETHRLVLTGYNDVGHLEEEGAPVTVAPDTGTPALEPERP
ncbi:MAG: histidine phosphatase family protein [Deltaproteobacteria bacterium]|nr:histidine phosphatase family protein [Deltaproteobacteria bacterium]